MASAISSTEARTVSKVVSVGTVVASASFGLTLIKLFQIFDFLKLINVEIPINFASFLELF